MKPAMPSAGPGNYAGKSISHLQAHIHVLRAELQQRSPHVLADATGVQFQPGENGQGIFNFSLWQQAVHVSYPDYVAVDAHTRRELGTAAQALVLYYFLNCRGEPEAGRWISFSELPDGRFYTQAFQSYTGRELYAHFGDDLDRVDTAMQSAGGINQSIGDRSFAFRMLPKVSLGIVYWRGDDDFPSTYQVLFDAVAAQHLPTDACAIAGSMLVRRVMAAA
jgi:hypothetical protein